MRLSERFLKAIPSAGYAARGTVYCIIGGLALTAALVPGGETPSTKGALLKLLESAYGTILLSALASGLLCYSVWRLFQSITDADGHGRSLKGLTVRGALFGSGITHGLLGGWAFSAVLRGGGGDNGPTMAQWLMQQPYGAWLAGGAGLLMLAIGCAHAWKGVTGHYEKWFAADKALMAWMHPIASTGLVGRGMVFLLTGGLMIYAAWRVEPEKAGGLKEALQWLQGLPYGPALLLAAGGGLLCFGVYSLLETLFRRISGPGTPAPAPRNAS